MAPATMLYSTGAVQSFYQSTASSLNVWQTKRLVLLGPPLNRTSVEFKVEAASVISCFPAAVYDSRRRVDLRHVAWSGTSRHVFTTAVEGSLAVEEPSREAEVLESSEEKASEGAVPEKSLSPATPPQRKGRNGQWNTRAKREEPTVPKEAIVPGAVFSGKVTSIQPFGAFVNIGAFTDGLVHISKLISGYVSNVSDVVSVGQEVQVTVIDVDNTSGRISLSMINKEEKESSATRSGDRTRSQEENGGKSVNKGKIAGRGNQANRREEPKKPRTKLVKGQAVEGTVKNSVRGGVYVLLAEEEEGFLKYTEIPGGENMAPEVGLQVGQKINATVLRIDRGKILLSMKPVVDLKNVNIIINKDANAGATNPFEIAFRAMNLIPEKDEVAEASVEEEAPVTETQESTSAAVVDSEGEKSEDVELVQAAKAVVEEAPAREEPAPAGQAVEGTKIEELITHEIPADATAKATAPETIEEKVEEVTEATAAEDATPTPVEEIAESPDPETGALALVV